MTYIHSNNEKIHEFVQDNIHDRSSLQTICKELFTWFDENIKYSRLNAPFFPLQRSDLDVLSMQSGTCGDYSNLLVSVLRELGYETRYAYVHRDCYGDEQDHICVAVRDGEQWILVDATQPYRKWYGFDCPHQEYELLLPNDFEEKMKKEEHYWTNIAKQYGNEAFAGLLYAPWIHEETIRQSENILESVFFLLSLDEQKNMTLYAYFKRYSKRCGTMPVMCIISKETQKYCFSCKKPHSIWDNEQWSEEYLEEDIPDRFKTEAFYELKNCIAKVLPNSNTILALEKVSANIFNVTYDEKSIGEIELYNNTFHEQNQYLKLDLQEYNCLWSNRLFSLLRNQIGKPLQVMSPSENVEQRNFLLAGGFVCRRKCYEMEVSQKDLVASTNAVPLKIAHSEEPEWTDCAKIMFDYYKGTHGTINPLTVDMEAFCNILPKEVLFQEMDGEIKHVAFIEENEIAYIGSFDVSSVKVFAESVVSVLFNEFETIVFECDDCDIVAMTLRQLFSAEIEESYDTYILC